MPEVNMLIDAANKRVKASNPELDKKGNPKPQAKKKSMEQFLEENNI
jgi:hypothetical protein